MRKKILRGNYAVKLERIFHKISLSSTKYETAIANNITVVKKSGLTEKNMTVPFFLFIISEINFTILKIRIDPSYNYRGAHC